MTSSNALADAYLELMKQALTGSLYDQSRWKIVDKQPGKPTLKSLYKAMTGAPAAPAMLTINPNAYTPDEVHDGKIWTMFGLTMIGHKRLDNVQWCIEQVLSQNIPGDLVETGVWKGGCVIFMRAVLKAHGIADRQVWAADSFEGLPVPVDAEDGTDLSKVEELKVSLEQVQDHFRRFDLLDDQVRFLKGWFADTLPTAPIEKIAVLRLDGDLYSSTMDALRSLYHKVSRGGFVIVDDYYSWESCRRAVHDFAKSKGFTPDIKPVDWTGAYWQVER
ncbi:MAG: TylF/MycF/NovP-related O-methyltransferase [Deltaproteobacteria bacterium]